MKASTFTFQSTDGTEIFVYAWLPDGEVRAVVQVAHGMAEHAGRYAPLAEALTAHGYAVYAHDHRGHGKSAASEQELGHFADDDGWTKLVADVHQLTGLLHDKHPGVPLYLFGHSMGSFAVQRYLFSWPEDIDGAILSGSNGKVGLLAAAGAKLAALETLRLGKRGRSALLHALSFGAFNKAFKPNRTELDWLSRDPANVDAYIDDPHCGFVCTTQSWRDFLAGFAHIEDPKNHARIPKDLPIYIFAGAKDPLSKETKGLKRLLRAYRLAGLRKVEHRFYPDGRHEMLNETNRAEVHEDILAWLERVGAQRDEARGAA